MFKLMIADDNPHTLRRLSESIDWEAFDFYLVGTYPDGQKLLEAAGENQPDLVITDISMPIMDGFDLTSALYSLKSDIKIVFMSSYSEFNYARTALKLGVFDYILKPLNTDQLLDIMDRILTELRGEELKRFEQQKLLSQQDHLRKVALSHYISRLFFHAENEHRILAELNDLGLSFSEDMTDLYVVCYSVATDCDMATDDIDHLSVSHDYLQAILENDTEDVRIILSTFGSSQGAFLVLAPKETTPIFDLLSRLIIDIETKMGLSLNLGYSTASQHFSDLPLLYQQAQNALSNLQHDKFYTPIVSFADIHMDCDADKTAERHTPDSTIDTETTANPNVIAMRKYIEEHYMEPITSNDVTKSVFLSSSYANRCFLAQYDTTIFGYIIYCRLEKAKQLLRDTDINITRIAEMVGYSAKTSFYLAFKRHTGISPTEYRQGGN